MISRPCFVVVHRFNCARCQLKSFSRNSTHSFPGDVRERPFTFYFCSEKGGSVRALRTPPGNGPGIVTTVLRKTAHRRISFLIVVVSAPERHWIGFQSHFARAANATYSVGTVRSSGRTRSSSRTRSSGRTRSSRPYAYIQARAWQYKFHHLTYLREVRFAR